MSEAEVVRKKRKQPARRSPSAPSKVPATLEKILTASEKREICFLTFHDLHFENVDLSNANLAGAQFFDVSLAGSDLSGADLRGAQFVRCDLRRVRFERAHIGRNRFEGSWLTATTGLSASQKAYICRRGGRFLAALAGRDKRRPPASSR